MVVKSFRQWLLAVGSFRGQSVMWKRSKSELSLHCFSLQPMQALTPLQTSVYQEYLDRPTISKYYGLTQWQWLFLVLGALQLGSILVLSALDVWNLIDLSQLESASFVLDLNIALICLVSVTFLVYGIFGAKQNEVCLFLLAVSLCSFYVAIEFALTAQYGSVVKLVRLCSTLTLSSMLLVTSKMVVISSDEYSIIGVSPALLSMYRAQRFFLLLLKFDFLCSVSFALFNIGVTHSQPEVRYVALALSLLVSGLQWITGRFAVVKEIRSCLLLFVSLFTLSLLWVPLQFVFLETCFAGSLCSSQSLLLGYGSLVAAFVLIVVRVWLFMQLLKVYKNFGYGLADSAFIGLASETTRLMSRSTNSYRVPLDL